MEQHHDGQLLVHGTNGFHHGLRLDLVVHDGVVERTVGFHIFDGRAGGLRQGMEGADLVDDVVRQFRRRHVDEAPPESRKVAVARVCSRGDTGGRCHLAGRSDSAWVAGMEPAGNIHAGNRGANGCVVSEGPVAEGFSDVAVQIYDGHF